MALSIEEEEAQKKALIDEQSSALTNKMDELFTLQKFDLAPTYIEQEFFIEN